MIRQGRAVDGDLFLDYVVKGNLLTRPGSTPFSRRHGTFPASPTY